MRKRRYYHFFKNHQSYEFRYIMEKIKKEVIPIFCYYVLENNNSPIDMHSEKNFQ